MIKSLSRKRRQEKLNSKFGFISYSQDGEDMILRSFYEEKPDYKGFYIDIGALHPFRFSNTCFFYNTGWRGINIEPTPTAISLFKEHRPEDINLNIAIGEKKEELTFFCFNEPALNSFSKALSEERDGEKEYHIVDKIPVMVYPLSEVLSQYVSEGQTIDFMSIDVEGLDSLVLKSNDWKKFRPQYLLVEDCIDNINELFESTIYSFLVNLNYTLLAKTKRTLILKDSL